MLTATGSLVAVAGATLGASVALAPSGVGVVADASAAEEALPKAIRAQTESLRASSTVSRTGERVALADGTEDDANAITGAGDGVDGEASEVITEANQVLESADALAVEQTLAGPEELAAIANAIGDVQQLIDQVQAIVSGDAGSNDGGESLAAGAETVFDEPGATAAGDGPAGDVGTTAEAASSTSVAPALMPEATDAAQVVDEIAGDPGAAAESAATGPVAETASADAGAPQESDTATGEAATLGSETEPAGAAPFSAGDATNDASTVPDDADAAAPANISTYAANDTEAVADTEARAPGAAAADGSDQPAVTEAADDADALLAALEDATVRLDELISDPSLTSPVGVTPAPLDAATVLAEQAAAALADAPNLAHWAGATASYGNGQLPDSALCAMASDPTEQIRCDAEAQFRKLNEAFKAEFGYDVGITDSYRSYARQVEVKALRGKWAATPGYSNHGWGVALDLGTGIATYGSPQYNWMARNAAKFGWHNPDWARPGGTLFEPWHWEYTPLA